MFEAPYKRNKLPPNSSTTVTKCQNNSVVAYIEQIVSARADRLSIEIRVVKLNATTYNGLLKLLTYYQLMATDGLNGYPISYIWQNFVRPKIKCSSTTENIFFSFGKPDNISSSLVNPHIVLNIIGYYPDDNKNLISNSQGFMSDVRHVSMALRTDVFLTYDNNLAHRAAALYKWENNRTGLDMMTVFKRFGKRDVLDYAASEGETADQASDRSKCLYTGGSIIYAT